MRDATRIRRVLLPALALLVVLIISGCGERESIAVDAPPTDVVFTIERGALARQMRGEVTELIPGQIDLVTGQSIIIHNQDQALHYFLSEPVWPGETLTRTFDEPGTYRFDGAFTCSIGTITTFTVYVSEPPVASG